MGSGTSGAEHLTQRGVAGSGSEGFLHSTSHMRTQMGNYTTRTTALLPSEMMLKVSPVFPGCDRVILMQARCLVRYRKENRTGFEKLSSPSGRGFSEQRKFSWKSNKGNSVPSVKKETMQTLGLGGP